MSELPLLDKLAKDNKELQKVVSELVNYAEFDNQRIANIADSQSKIFESLRNILLALECLSSRTDLIEKTILEPKKKKKFFFF